MVRNRNLKCVSVLTKDFKNVEGQKKKNNILIYKVAEWLLKPWGRRKELTRYLRRENDNTGWNGSFIFSYTLFFINALPTYSFY